MAIYYDLHIHSALSPCGDEDMTPNNIVNMAVLKGLDMIAVTDHNCALNLPAINEVARENGIMLINGLEVQTREEAHILCYFKTLTNALQFGNIVYESLPDSKNTPELFGFQHVLDSRDNIIGNVEKLLLSSSDLSINQLSILVQKFSGIMIPAHVDRSSYSIISNLGFIPSDLNIKSIEISKNTNEESFKSNFPYTKNMTVIKSSDAHYLWDISERDNSIPIDEIKIGDIFQYLNN